MNAPAIAKRILKSSEDSLEELRVHLFEDDEEANDEELGKQLLLEFTQDFETAKAQLSKIYGPPSIIGSDGDATQDIPLAGILSFAIWSVTGKHLYLALTHEDREAPVLLMIGTMS